jgi:GNAT superfamily N-acetyltransferase
MNIREAKPDDAASLALLISQSNRDVASRFKLSFGNCPKHPSFCQADWVLADLARGERYFLAEAAAKPVACVAFEPASAGVGYLNRLSVLPLHRRCGVGALLVQHVMQLARVHACHCLSIGVIGAHLELQRWYQKLGFVTGDTKSFAHLPFSVTYMRLALT